jgi:hypothetical protein
LARESLLGLPQTSSSTFATFSAQSYNKIVIPTKANPEIRVSAAEGPELPNQQRKQRNPSANDLVTQTICRTTQDDFLENAMISRIVKLRSGSR